MRRFSMLAICLFLITVVGCDNYSKDASVVGTIINVITQQPVPGVKITMGLQVTESDQYGRFAFVGDVENADLTLVRQEWQFEQAKTIVTERSVYQIKAIPPTFELHASPAIKLGFYGLNASGWPAEIVNFNGFYLINNDITSFSLYRWSESGTNWQWINEATTAEAINRTVYPCKMCDFTTADAAQYVIVANTPDEKGVFTTPIISYRMLAEMAPGIEPKGDIGSDQPKFRWAPTNDFEQYKVGVTGAKGNLSMLLLPDNTIPSYLDSGNYYWRYYGITYVDQYTLVFAKSGLVSFSIR